MTDSKGAPVRSLNTGEKIPRKMRDGDDAPAIAKRLTMEVYRMLRGETAPTATEFDRAISHPPVPAFLSWNSLFRFCGRYQSRQGHTRDQPSLPAGLFVFGWLLTRPASACAYPNVVFPRLVEHAFDVAVQRPHDTDARHHGRPVELDDQEAGW
jgi:hypothetical protein